MPECDYVYDSFRPARGETIEVPEDAVGVSLTTFGDPENEKDAIVSVKYLLPVEDHD